MLVLVNGMTSLVRIDSKEHHHRRRLVNKQELSMRRQRVRWVGHSLANFDAENAAECFPTPPVVSVRSVVFDDDDFFFRLSLHHELENKRSYPDNNLP